MQPDSTPSKLPSITTSTSKPTDLVKQHIEEALRPVVNDLTALESKLLSFIPTETDAAERILTHLFAAGGKRIRPALFFFCCRLFNYRGASFYPISAVCEFVHTASLLHDDVIDSSSLRRNKPTANSIWGDQSSVLVGDLIYSRASELMAATGSLEIVATFARAIRLMSEGELLQLECAFRTDITEDDYFKILDCKTGVLIAASCRAAGILADADVAERNALTNFGAAVGVAFQLIDDALDYLSTTDLFGKQARADLREGKITLPIILLRESCTTEEWEQVVKIVKQTTLSDQDIARVCELVDRYDTANRTLTRASEYTERALAALHVLPASDARADLERLASRLLWRTH